MCRLSRQLPFKRFLQTPARPLQIDCKEEKPVDSTQSGFQSNTGPCCDSRVKVSGCHKWPPPETDCKLLNLEHIAANSSPLCKSPKITQVCCNYQTPQEQFPLFLDCKSFYKKLYSFLTSPAVWPQNP